MTTVLVCATPEVESELSRTLFWRDDLERYVADRADEARELALVTDPNIVVVDLGLFGAARLIASLRNSSPPHLTSIVALSHDPADSLESAAASGGCDRTLSLPSSPAWDDTLVEILQVPPRRRPRFDVRIEAVVARCLEPAAHRGLVLNISVGGLLLECPGLPLRAGDGVDVRLPIEGESECVEARARVLRQPAEDHFGMQFESFAGDGDASLRRYVETLAEAPRP